jgi:hypothetical protein
MVSRSRFLDSGSPQTIKAGAIAIDTNTEEDALIITGPTGTTKVNILYIGL